MVNAIQEKSTKLIESRDFLMTRTGRRLIASCLGAAYFSGVAIGTWLFWQSIAENDEGKILLISCVLLAYLCLFFLFLLIICTDRGGKPSATLHRDI